jgi:type IV pilus assembly protein PilA
MIQHQCIGKRERENSQGFTIIELLVVFIIIGILSALALPSFLNQANKAQQSEAKTYIGSMNRAQQAEYSERGNFTTDISILGLGITPETNHYIYTITTSSASSLNVVNRAIPSDGNFNNTPDPNATVKAYIGGVRVSNISATSSSVGVLAVLCEALNSPLASGNDGTTAEPNNFAATAVGAPTCDPADYKTLK